MSGRSVARRFGVSNVVASEINLFGKAVCNNAKNEDGHRLEKLMTFDLDHKFAQELSDSLLRYLFDRCGVQGRGSRSDSWSPRRLRL